MRFRPGLVADYREDAAIFRTGTQRVWIAVLLVVLVLLGVGAGIPILPGLFTLTLEGDMLLLAVTALVAAIGAIGLNIVTGFAGQVSLGHAFFLGIGAFTAALLGGEEVVRSVSTGEIVRGYELDMIIWLPASGLVAALAGLIVAPVAFRLKGLYLAFVTLGLVFVGGHLFREFKGITGGVGLGREAAVPSLLGFRFDEDGEVFGIFLSAEQKHFFLALVLLLVMGLAARNLARSRIGRALSAIRDRDIAAEIMGISLTRYKTIAFVVSSFYAGIAGALLFSVIGRVEPTEFSDLPGLLLSVEYIAMVLIGGIATISGSIMGAVFIIFLPRMVEELAATGLLGFIGESAGSGLLDVSQLARVLFGGFIVVFLIFEPLGLYGIWIRVRNYWKAFPFSY
ncbi:MAG: branched-chain amino acid ABC transporter permease [Acidimicrobiia bacterium]|nr:branched-chain amino acid ABC transporter permease [Acidimicrobiia bacterium]